jgi:hypothetical protein
LALIKNKRLLVALAGILSVLAILYAGLAHMEGEREKELARLNGEDGYYRSLVNDLDRARIANKNDKFNILVLAGVVVFAAALGWAGQRLRGPEKLSAPEDTQDGDA